MQSAQLLVPVTERDHSIGPSNAVVTLVEYGDFECSFCRKAYSMLQGLRRYMGDNLRFVYRHFPLAEAHPRKDNRFKVELAQRTLIRALTLVGGAS